MWLWRNVITSTLMHLSLFQLIIFLHAIHKSRVDRLKDTRSHVGRHFSSLLKIRTETLPRLYNTIDVARADPTAGCVIYEEPVTDGERGRRQSVIRRARTHSLSTLTPYIYYKRHTPGCTDGGDFLRRRDS